MTRYLVISEPSSYEPVSNARERDQGHFDDVLNFNNIGHSIGHCAVLATEAEGDLQRPEAYDLEDSRLCTNPLAEIGWRWVEHYRPAVRLTGGGVKIIPGRSRHECAHCAYVDARSYQLPSWASETEYRYTVVRVPRYSEPREEDLLDETPPSNESSTRRLSDLPAYLPQAPFVRLDRIGVEIEGRWFPARYADLYNRYPGYVDGSVDNEPGYVRFEFQTRPADSLEGALRQVHELFPDDTSQECGMHVHMSFKDHADIGLLDSPAFYTLFREEFANWATWRGLPCTHPFWPRIRGENHFCEENNTSIECLLSHERFSQFNYSAFLRHKTVECRMLPMFDDEADAISAIAKLVSLVETYLARQGDQAIPTIDPVVIDQEFEIPGWELDEVVDWAPTAPEELTLHIDLPELPAPASDERRIAVTQDMTYAQILRLAQEIRQCA